MLYIPITNPSLENAQKTMLSKRAEVGDTVLNVYSGVGFGCNEILLIGNYNEEIAEIVYTHATTLPTTTTITINPGLKFSHSVDTPVREMLYDRFNIYRSDDNGETFVLEATIDINPDDIQTVYVSNSSPNSYFRIAPYNSITDTEGLPSDVLKGTGLDFASVANIIDRVYDLFADPKGEFITSDQQILNYLNEGYLDMWIRLAGLGQGYGTKRTGIGIDSDIALTPTQTIYNLPTGFLAMTGAFINNRKLTYINPTDFEMMKETADSNAPIYTIYANKIEIAPPMSGNLRLYYVYTPEPLQSMVQTIDLPSPYVCSKILVDYCVARLYEKAYKPERASYFLQAYENGIVAWLNSLSKRRYDSHDKVDKFDTGLEDIVWLY